MLPKQERSKFPSVHPSHKQPNHDRSQQNHSRRVRITDTVLFGKSDRCGKVTSRADQLHAAAGREGGKSPGMGSGTKQNQMANRLAETSDVTVGRRHNGTTLVILCVNVNCSSRMIQKSLL